MIRRAGRDRSPRRNGPSARRLAQPSAAGGRAVPHRGALVVVRVYDGRANATSASTCPAFAEREPSRPAARPQLPARRRLGGGRRGRAARRARAVSERARATEHSRTTSAGAVDATRVLDKLNVLGAPFGRVVWSTPTWATADDELCALAPNAALRRLRRLGFRARTCFDPNGGRGAAFKLRATPPTTTAARRWRKAALPVRAQFGGDGRPPARRRRVCVSRRAAGAGGRGGRRRGGDQGAYNTPALHARPLRRRRRRRARAAEHVRPRTRAQAAPERVGGDGTTRRAPSLVHFSRETKPWASCTPTRRIGARAVRKARREGGQCSEKSSTRVRQLFIKVLGRERAIYSNRSL